MTTPVSYEALQASHKAMLEILVQIWEEILCPLDALMPEWESIISTAEQIEKGSRRTHDHPPHTPYQV